MPDKYHFGFELFDSLPGMFFFLTPEGGIKAVNKSAADFFKHDKNLLSGHFTELIELCDREKVNKILSEAILDKSRKEVETRFYSNGNYTNFNLSFSFIASGKKDKNKNFVIVFARDITTEKNKMIELQRFYNIAENSINPVQITDLTGRMIYVNPAFEKASGYSREELIGKNPRIFGSGRHPKKFWDKMWQTISSGKTWFGEVEDRKKNGQAFYSQLLISPMIDNDGKISGYFGIHRDISEKKTLEQRLMQTQKMESIGTLAAGVAHEVGNPLASISALVQVAQRNTKDQFVLEKLTLVKSQITRISKIIRDLVDFSRPSNFELQTMDINECIRESVEIIKLGTKVKDIEYTLKLSNEVPPMPLIADQLEQVFVNILLNAVDAMNEAKEPLNKKEIIIESSVDDDYIIITFFDTGPGIKEENKSKIFEPFFTTKQRGKGTGLGLWVSYGIIKNFHGTIELESQVGKGTTFIIKLPINKK